MDFDARAVRHFIWDFDGTLFDTYPGIIQALRGALAAYGRDAQPREAMEKMLESIPAACRFYAQRCGIPQQELWQAFDARNRAASASLAALPMEGAPQALRSICKAGGRNYIFTHRRLAETEAFLEKYGLAPLVCDIVAPEHGFAPKPSPEAVQYLLRRHDIPAAAAVMVGDRAIDLASGQAAGIASLHLVCAAVPQHLPCTWRLQSLTQLPALFYLPQPDAG